MFVASKVLWWLLAPSSWLILFPLLMLVALWLRKYRSAALGFSLYVFVMLAIAFLPVHTWLLRPLEQRFPILHQADLPDTVAGIIVLGGAMSENMTTYYQQSNFNGAAERMTATTELALHYPEATVLLSGGSGLLVGEGEVTEAAVARDFLLARAIPASRLLQEDQSRNTVENVRYSLALAQPQSEETWLLVTSAYHIPRSIGIFRRYGWQVVPYPVDYRTAPPQIIDNNHDLLERFDAIDTAVREYIGLLAYRILGHTDAWFPAP